MRNQKSNLLWVLAGFILPALILTACEKEAEPGHIAENTTWSGQVTLTGDIIVDAGATLTIEPGTIITVMADQDDMQLSHLGDVDGMTTSDPTADPNAGGTEYQKSHISLIVNGRIVCKGTAEEPILFKSSKPQPYYTDWVGILANDGEFAYTTVEWCLNGIYSTNNYERLTIDHCHVRHIWAAGTGFQRPKVNNGASYIKHSTIEDCGHEAVDTHSPGMIEMAYNLVKDCQVGFNLQDNVIASIHHNLVLRTTHPVLCANNPEVFITQCVFQASIQDNTRWSYQGWTMPLIGNPACIFIPAGNTQSVVCTNSILLDSPVGIQSEVQEGVFTCGYLNFDNVATPFAVNATQGAGCTTLESGFVDETGGDYRLQASSPLKGQGNPADGSPDLGAYGGNNAEAAIGWEN